jgi:hypothetical protein
VSVRARLVQLTISGDEERPLMEVSLYPAQTATKSSSDATEKGNQGC